MTTRSRGLARCTGGSTCSSASPSSRTWWPTGQLLEWAKFAGNCYGTPRGPVAERLARGLPGLLEVDVVGARQVRAAVPGALLVFLAPPSWDELVRRLTGRETEPADVIEQRLEAARAS